MASIRKRGRKWQVQVRRKGFPLFTRTFHERADALKWARGAESHLDNGVLPRLDYVAELETVGDPLRRYRDNVTTQKRGQEPEQYRLNSILGDTLADWPLKSLTPDLTRLLKKSERLRCLATTEFRKRRSRIDVLWPAFCTNQDCSGPWAKKPFLQQPAKADIKPR